MRRVVEQAWQWSREPSEPLALSDFDAGYIVAILARDGHFGGDGKQAQVTLRLHTKEETLLHWLLERLPAGRLYGPYEYVYKDGGTRRFFQLMYRGEALKEQLIPFLESHEWAGAAPEAHAKYLAMRSRYRA